MNKNNSITLFPELSFLTLTLKIKNRLLCNWKWISATCNFSYKKINFIKIFKTKLLTVYW